MIVLHGVGYLCWVLDELVDTSNRVIEAIELVEALDCIKVVQSWELASLVFEKSNGKLTGILHSVGKVFPHVCNLWNFSERVNHFLHFAIKADQGLLDEQHVQSNSLEMTSSRLNKWAFPWGHPKARLHFASTVVELRITDLASSLRKGIVNSFLRVLGTAFREHVLEGRLKRLECHIQMFARQPCEQSRNMQEFHDDGNDHTDEECPDAAPQANCHPCLRLRSIWCAELVKGEWRERGHQKSHACQRRGALADSQRAEPIDDG